MQSHSQQNIDSVLCPFALNSKGFEFDKVASVISVDDKECSIIVEMFDKQRFIVEIPKVVYDAI